MPQSTRPKGGSLFYQPPGPKKTEIRKKRWNAGSIIWNAVKRTCMVIGAMVLFSALLTFITLVTAVSKTAPALPKDMVLVLKLEQGIAEKQDEASFGDFFPAARPTIRQITNTLTYAADDERIKALIVNVKAGGLSIGHVQEFRVAVKRFRASGKKAYFYSSSFVDTGSGVGAYYLASAFDQIWMQPVGLLSISGFSAEVPLGREALEKVGVRAQFLQRESYKTAMESFTESELTPESREMIVSMLKSFSSQVIGDIAKDRQVSERDLAISMDKGILTGDDALQSKLIDRLDYGDVLVSGIREEIMGDPEDKSLELVSFRQYANAADGAHKDKPNHMPGMKAKPKVALIYVAGAIVPMATGANMAAADEIAPAIIEAAEDKDVDAIVIRINSPGGSPTASETIRRAIVRAKEKGKYVAVSMGDVAASGGYWVAADADVIFANPSTLTGSIGVIMGKFESSGLWEKLGVNWGTVQVGDNAGLWSMNRPFDDRQLAHLNTLIDSTYDAFMQRVAAGRGMSLEEVRRVAQGRVWTGELAIGKGLVDKQGGLYDTLTHIAMYKGVMTPDKLEVVVLPRPKSAVEQFIELLGGTPGVVSAFSNLDKFVNVLEPVLISIQQVQNPHIYMTYDSDLEMFRQ